MKENNPTIDSVYLTNIENNKEHYKSLICELATLGGLNKIRFHKNIIQQVRGTQPERLSELKIILAHLEIIRNALDRNESRILVLDTTATPIFDKNTFSDSWTNVFKYLPDDWWLFYLGGLVSDTENHRPLENINKYIYKVIGCTSIHAVAYSRKMMEFMVNLQIQKSLISWMQSHERLDLFYAKYIQTKFSAYISKPLLFGKRVIDGTVANVGENYNSRCLKNYIEFGEISTCNQIPVLDKNSTPEYLNQFHYESGTTWQLVSIKHIKDLERWERLILTDHYINSKSLDELNSLYKGKLSVWLMEPRAINPSIYTFVEKNKEKFEFIFTHELNLVEHIKNAKYVSAADCWVGSIDQRIYNKSKNISFLSTSKIHTKGHKLRKEIFDNLSDKFDICKYGGPKDPISKFFIEPRFSVVVENSQAPGYFTEKIIHCFRTGTIPIYWGDPAISRHFDAEGILKFESLNELRHICWLCNEQLYQKMFKSVINNFNLSEKFSNISINIIKSVIDCFT